MEQLLVLNGPNLGFLGERDQRVYGTKTLSFINEQMSKRALERDFRLVAFQSNHEGALIDKIQEMKKKSTGMIINPGGLSHQSVSLYDAIIDYKKPSIEVHISHPLGREDFRHSLLTARASCGLISGFGWKSYVLALEALMDKVRGEND
jgi:3-dehydroquinate dehydratase II